MEEGETSPSLLGAEVTEVCNVVSDAASSRGIDFPFGAFDSDSDGDHFNVPTVLLADVFFWF
jgi:hypothetical protein